MVAVDGETVRRQGMVIDPARQSVTVRGRLVRLPRRVYLALNKPRGILCTSRDPGGRPTVQSLLPAGLPRVYTVGRLDRDSEGLLLLTNDGDFAHALAHPRHHVPKTYLVWTASALDRPARERMLAGVEDDGEVLRALAVDEIARTAAGARYRVVLGEGRKRQIRRMMAACGLSVRRLQRVAVGGLQLGGLRPGEVRPLCPAEVRRLLAEAGRPPPGEMGLNRRPRMT